MPSFEYRIDECEQAGTRFLARVRSELQRAFVSEKAQRKLTQQAIADKLKVNRSVVNRQLMGLENLTAMSIGQLLWAIGWEGHFEAQKTERRHGDNTYTDDAYIVTPVAVTASGTSYKRSPAVTVINVN